MNPVLTTCATVILGAVLAYIAQYLHFQRQSGADKRSLRLTKLEELYVVFTDIEQHYRETFTTASGYLQPRVFTTPDDQNTALEKARKAAKPIPFSRMKMLIMMYAPALCPHIDAVFTIRNRIGDLIVDCLLSDKLTDEERDKKEAMLSEGMSEMAATVSVACEDIVRLSTELLE